MKLFNTNTSLNSIIQNANPINWTPESKKLALKIGGVTLVAFVALTALENLPTALAASQKYVYDCHLSATGNAAKAYAEVLYNTFDYRKAKAASELMIEVGEKVDAYVSGNVLTYLCQTIADTFPYTYTT